VLRERLASRHLNDDDQGSFLRQTRSEVHILVHASYLYLQNLVTNAPVRPVTDTPRLYGPPWYGLNAPLGGTVSRSQNAPRPYPWLTRAGSTWLGNRRVRGHASWKLAEGR